MKMTTEEAFIKVLQMHGIEHAFGIIGSAMMPISDLFPAAGIKFWDCAHEVNAGMSADGYTRVTGKMSMAIAQNGPGITNFVTPIMTAFWNHTPLLLPGSQADGNLRKLRLLPGRSARSEPYGRSPQPRYRKRLARQRTGANQHPARLLDPGHRHRAAPSNQAGTFARW
jgi:hypothetical protein